MPVTQRERFWRTMRFDTSAGIPFWADWLGPWKRWRAEGLDVDVASGEETLRTWCLERFGFEGMYSIYWGQPRVPADIGVYPPFTEDVIEETDAYRVYVAGNGVVVRQLKDTGEFVHSTQFLSFPIASRKDWEKYREERLDPMSPGRYPDGEEWHRLRTGWKDRTFTLSVDGGSFYGLLRDWIGVERLSVWMYDERPLVREMMEYLSGFYIQVLERAVDEVDIDFAMFWEDMCYKTGPLISPSMFRELMVPCYKRVTSFLAQHGVSLSWVDCDGNIDQLIPLWIQGGIRGFYPLEVAANMDAAAVRARWGNEVVLWGNVDKRALASGRDAIDAEMARLTPVANAGGFIPLVDHQVPDDVPLENYLYYLEKRSKLCGKT